jgi:phosphatidylserine/phosphatidylglycerophosphate/cardiolipin synthase-like enzyme
MNQMADRKHKPAKRRDEEPLAGQLEEVVEKADEVDDNIAKVLGGRVAPAVVLIIAVVVAAYFVYAGQDPLGLFGPAESDNIPAPSQPAPDLPPVELPPNSGSGTWWQTMFTDPNAGGSVDDLSGTIAEQLIYRIGTADESIHIAAFELNLLPVAEALSAASRRGVEVQWVTDDEYGLEADQEEGQLFPMMERAGVEVRADDRDALMHNKFIIFDGQTVWTGSTNLTENGIFRNNNNVLVVESPEAAAIYEREFQELWAGQFGPSSPSTVDQQSVTVASTDLEIRFAPEDEAMAHLISLVEGAQESIYFMAFSFTDDNLAAAMLDKIEEGVEVKGIFETRGSESPYSELYSIACAGMDVRQDGNPGTMHHKVIIIDGRTLATGSFNFSENADESNDENLISLANAVIARQYQREFDRLWAEARPIPDEELPCR